MEATALPDEDRSASPVEEGTGGPGAPAGAQAGTGRWVESSWDLRRGLTVREGLPPDADLDEWLEAMLRG